MSVVRKGAFSWERTLQNDLTRYKGDKHMDILFFNLIFLAILGFGIAALLIFLDPPCPPCPCSACEHMRKEQKEANQ